MRTVLSIYLGLFNSNIGLVPFPMVGTDTPGNQTGFFNFSNEHEAQQGFWPPNSLWLNGMGGYLSRRVSEFGLSPKFFSKTHSVRTIWRVPEGRNVLSWTVTDKNF